MHAAKTLGTAVALAALAALAPAAAAAAPIAPVMTYEGRLLRSDGTPETSVTSIAFTLYPTATGTTEVWSDVVTVTPGTDGWFSVVLGALTPLPMADLDQPLWLGIQVQGELEMRPRLRLTSAPYALQVDWSGVSGKPGACAGAGEFVRGYDAGGNAICAVPAGGGGGGVASVTAVTPGGVNVTGTGTAVQLALSTCSNGQILKVVGGSWLCSDDALGLTGVTVDSAVFTGAGTGASPLALKSGVLQPLLATSCPGGQRVTGFASGVPTCADDQLGLTAVASDPAYFTGSGVFGSPLGLKTGAVQLPLTSSCLTGQALRGFSAAGAPSCTVIGSVTAIQAGNGIAVDNSFVGQPKLSVKADTAAGGLAFDAAGTLGVSFAPVGSGRGLGDAATVARSDHDHSRHFTISFNDLLIADPSGNQAYVNLVTVPVDATGFALRAVMLPGDGYLAWGAVESSFADTKPLQSITASFQIGRDDNGGPPIPPINYLVDVAARVGFVNSSSTGQTVCWSPEQTPTTPPRVQAFAVTKIALGFPVPFGSCPTPTPGDLLVVELRNKTAGSRIDIISAMLKLFPK